MPDNTRIMGDHDRQIANMARIGTVSEIHGNRARVSIGALETDLIPWTSRSAARDYEWWQPTVGEQVVVLCLWGDVSQGVIIGALGQNRFHPPAQGKVWARRFSDGTVISYNPDSHALDIQAGSSPVTVTCDTLTVKAQSVTLDTPKLHCTGTITSDSDVLANGISLRSHTHHGVKAGPDTTQKPK